jgi:hypothetical protein
MTLSVLVLIPLLLGALMRRQYDHIDLRMRSLAEARHNHFAARDGDLAHLVCLVRLVRLVQRTK